MSWTVMISRAVSRSSTCGNAISIVFVEMVGFLSVTK